MIGRFEGEVFSGMKKAEDYLSLEPYKQKIDNAIGFRPFEGTLNLRVDPKEVEQLKQSIKPRVVESFKHDGSEYSRLEIYPVAVEGTEAAFLDIDITDYGEDVMEIIAPEKLRETLGVEDGDSVKISYREP